MCYKIIPQSGIKSKLKCNPGSPQNVGKTWEMRFPSDECTLGVPRMFLESFLTPPLFLSSQPFKESRNIYDIVVFIEKVDYMYIIGCLNCQNGLNVYADRHITFKSTG